MHADKEPLCESHFSGLGSGRSPTCGRWRGSRALPWRASGTPTCAPRRRSPSAGAAAFTRTWRRCSTISPRPSGCVPTRLIRRTLSCSAPSGAFPFLPCRPAAPTSGVLAPRRRPWSRKGSSPPWASPPGTPISFARRSNSSVKRGYRCCWARGCAAPRTARPRLPAHALVRRLRTGRCLRLFAGDVARVWALPDGRGGCRAARATSIRRRRRRGPHAAPPLHAPAETAARDAHALGRAHAGR